MICHTASIQDVVERREEIAHGLIRIRNWHRRRDSSRQRIVLMVIDFRWHSLLSGNDFRHVRVISLLYKMHFILVVSLYLLFVIGTVDSDIV